MSPFPGNDLPANQPWPPVPPDLDAARIEYELPEVSFTANSQIYRIKGHPSWVYKAGAQLREYHLQKAAGDCAMAVGGKVLSMAGGSLSFCGFLMELAAPVPSTLPPPQRRDIMHQMIRAVQRLHARRIIHGDMKLNNMLVDGQGRLRLCDFAEGRYVDEDEDEWDGISTWHYESPNRLRRGELVGRDPAPPTLEDDLYGLGLSIWQLYTGKVPHEDLILDDIGLKERQRAGKTVDVSEVHDLEARGIIIGLLRRGGDSTLILS